MSKSYWVISAALGLTVLTTEVWSHSAAEDEPRQEESAGNADTSSDGQNYQPIDLAPALEGIESAIRDLIAEEDKVAAEKQQSRESRDLEAQESMAKWAEWMFYATAATVVLTLVALFAIIRTLFHTRRAADYTEGMLNEAKATTKAAVISAGAGRAWLGYVAKQVDRLESSFVNGSRVNNGLSIYLVFANAGQSPALQCRINTRHEVLPADAPRPDPWKWQADIPPKITNSMGVANPGQTLDSGFMFFDDDQSARLRSGQDVVWVGVYISYVDALTGAECITGAFGKFVHTGGTTHRLGEASIENMSFYAETDYNRMM